MQELVIKKDDKKKTKEKKWNKAFKPRIANYTDVPFHLSVTMLGVEKVLNF
jgi:hypothetical protein